MASVVPAVNEGSDLGVEVFDRPERAAADGLAFDDAEPHLNQVQPGPGGRGVVDLDARVRGESVADLDPLVGGVVVHHQVQLATGVGAGDLLEEREELLMAVTGLARGSDRAGGDLQRCEEC